MLAVLRFRVWNTWRWQVGSDTRLPDEAVCAEDGPYPVLVGEGGTGKVMADGDLDAVSRDPHGVSGHLSELESLQRSLVGGNGATAATLEEVGGVGVAVDAGAVLDPVFAGDVRGFAPFHESEFDTLTIAEAADAAFACVAWREFSEFECAGCRRDRGERRLFWHWISSLSV
jgi:hypothetical protein